MRRSLTLCALVAFPGCFDYDPDPLPGARGEDTPDAASTLDAAVDSVDAMVESPPDAMPPVYAETCDDTVTYTNEPFTPANCVHEIAHPEGIEDIVASCGTPGPDLEGADAPVNLHLTFPTEDPSNAIAVQWVTGPSTRVSQVKLGQSPDALTEIWHGHNFTHRQLESRRVHEVHLCGLEPGRTYYYEAGGPGAWREGSFTTAPPLNSTEEFTFAVTGDSRSADYQLWSDTLQATDGLGVDMMLFSGDMVELGLLQAQWDGWFNAGDPYMARMPFIPANGNHDLLSLNYLAHFALPRNEENFHYRYGNALIISLNDFPAMDPQAIRGRTKEYLEATLKAHEDAQWKFIVNHRPFFSASTRHGSTITLQEEWMPFIDRYGVDVVFNGHDHNYERSRPIRNMEVVPMGQGTVYVVAAGVGAPLYDNGSQWWTETSEKVPSYAVVRVADKRLEFTAYRLDGTVLDQFTWTK